MTNDKKLSERIEAMPKGCQVWWRQRHGDIEEFEPMDGDQIKALLTRAVVAEAKVAEYEKALTLVNRIDFFVPNLESEGRGTTINVSRSQGQLHYHAVGDFPMKIDSILEAVRLVNAEADGEPYAPKGESDE